MRKAKRVRFLDTGLPSHDVVARRSEANQSPTSDAPKTSEYAYFKNIRNRSICGDSLSLERENKGSKSSNTNSLPRETSSTSSLLEPSTKNFRSSAQEENVEPSNHYLLLSPRPSKHDKPDHPRTDDLTNNTKQRSNLCPKNVTPVREQLSSSPSKASKISAKKVTSSWNGCNEKGIFAAKRRRLQQWVVPTSFTDAQELHPKGLDLVASLLGRLFPKGEECYGSSAGHDDRSKSPFHHEPNNLEKGLQLLHSRKWDVDLPKTFAGSSREILLSESDTFVSGLPLPNYGTENRFTDEKRGLDLHPYNRKINSLIQQDFSLCLPNERYDGTEDCFNDEMIGLDQHQYSHKRNSLTWQDFSFRFPIEGYDGTENRFNDEMMGLDQPPHRRKRNSLTRQDLSPSLPREGYDGTENRFNDEMMGLDQHPYRRKRNSLTRQDSKPCLPIERYDGSEIRFNDEMIGLDQYPYSCIRNSLTRQDFSFRLPVERHGSGSCHLKELDGSYSPEEHARKEPRRLLLEWECKRGENGVDSSIINYGSEENSHSRLTIPWHADHPKFVDNMLEVEAFCSSSLPSNCYVGLDAMPNYKSTSCMVPDFGSNHAFAKPTIAELEQFHLTSPRDPNSFSWVENLSRDNILCRSNSIFHYNDEHWLNKRFWNGLPHSESWQKSLVDKDFSAEDPPSISQTWQLPESETSLYSFPRLEEAPKEPRPPSPQGAFNHNYRSSNFQFCLDRELNSPLSLYNVSKGLSEKDLYFDEENELNYM